MATVASFKPFLTGCGYPPSHLVEGSTFGPGLESSSSLLAFAHEPFDAGTCCIGVLATADDPALLVERFRPSGAPIVFALHDQKIQWWALRPGRPEILEVLAPSDLTAFLNARREDLAPERLYGAKTRGRFEKGYQLDFVDVGLMPLVEQAAGEKLGELIEQAVEAAREELGTQPVTNQHLQLIFWLLAAKLLSDKNVPGFQAIDLMSIDDALHRVSAHYAASAHTPHAQTATVKRALTAAAHTFSRSANLAPVTPEVLASVYENSLVSKKTRAELGIHSTPSFLTRYVVWRLAPWIERIPLSKRHVFEPTCGQGSFLVAAMRLLRDLLPSSMGRPERKQYLRKRLHGLDIDQFAIELARLSLTLADVPNPDGWDLRVADAFAPDALTHNARQATILLANPPFEDFPSHELAGGTSTADRPKPGSKAAELLRRILPNLQPGAVFGVVVPGGFLQSSKARDVRSLLLEDFELDEILLLPDNIFSHSNAESSLLLGRRLRSQEAARPFVRYARIRERESELFKLTYQIPRERELSRSRLSRAPESGFLIPELDEVWKACCALPRLATLADIGQGFQFKSGITQATLSSQQAFPEAKQGFVRFDNRVTLDGLPRPTWLNLAPGVVRRAGSGTQTGIPQVLLNYAPISRGPWRLKALLDPAGHAVTSRFLTIRPANSSVSLHFLWALLNSPVANAFAFCHSTKRDNLKGTIDQIPLPQMDRLGTRSVEAAALRYLEYVQQEPEKTIFSPLVDEKRACSLLLDVDAELLRLYQLPSRLERQLLDLFSGYERPGVPFHFDHYFPSNFAPWIPLHLYLSPEFQRSTAAQLSNRWQPATGTALAALRKAVEAFEE